MIYIWQCFIFSDYVSLTNFLNYDNAADPILKKDRGPAALQP